MDVHSVHHMQTIRLTPDRLVTLTDFPVQNEHVLKIFFRIYDEGCGRIVPPVPVIHKDLVIPAFSEVVREKFTEFAEKNPAEYFLLDGSHRATAATLTGSKISAMVLKSKEDIVEAKQLANAGELFQFLLKDSMQGIIRDLVAHFAKNPIFQTVEQKTLRMCDECVIPKYMIKRFVG